MSTASDSVGSTSALVTYTKSGETHQSASSTSNEEYDLLDFLGVAQSLKIDFLPITWQPALGEVGEGGTAVIYQALINIQATFTFKRLKPSWSAMRTLIAEISILGHPAIRYHPNVANIEGICWDVVDGGEEVWPVLVLEKTRCGDLKRFMTSSSGKELDSKNRLDMLFDVALAVRDLHATGRFSIPPLLATLLSEKGVIHGDIKPENILVSSENEARHVAKVTDFGYSTLFSTDNHPITMPGPGIWTAPEWHHRKILPKQARKMDAYSFGMLCLWLLFYNKGTN
jgi:serine/threonine protein kinase